MATTQQRQHEIAAAISTAFVEAYNRNEPDRIDDAVTEDFVCHHMASGSELHGADEYKTRIEDLNAAFSGFSMSEEVLIVDGDMAAGRYRWSGTHEGLFEGIPATGRTVDTTSLTMMRMEGDRMAEMWVYGDGRGLMEQLGIER
ncbi:ester cyclase [Haloglomus litoreum]|uniref:ester cyclase n=1 Tax=Haloglomus litoreum TaxID=3034026 RepID=UPI0023E85822|nr:ester cyclase [Haloglomus sp. DT116]